MARKRRIVTGCLAGALCVFGIAGYRAYNELSPLNGLWGYIDTNGEFVIHPRFEYALPFDEGRAAVCVNVHTEPGPDAKGIWGFIDTEGAMIVPPKYQRAARFSEGRAAVQRDDKWGYIDRDGNEIVPCRYMRALPFKSGMAVVTRLRESGSGLTSMWGLVDLQGNEVVTPKYDEIGYFNDGLAWIREGATGWSHEPLGGKCGYIDHEGNVVIEAKWDDCTDFYQGTASVATGIDWDDRFYFYTGRWGAIDKEGRVFIEPRYAAYLRFKDGYSVATMPIENRQDHITQCVIDIDGNTVIAPAKHRIVNLGHGLFFIRKKDSRKWALYNDSGAALTEPIFRYGVLVPEESPCYFRCEVADSGTIRYFDLQGNNVPGVTDDDFQFSTNGFEVQLLANNTGIQVIRPDGIPAVQLDFVEKAEQFSEGLAPVKTLPLVEYLRR